MKYINNKTKGFTLIEILGVIVIMGLIMMVVIPTLSQMIHDNDNKAYKNYYDLIEEGTRVYAGKLTDKLGSSKYTGCTRITLSELIDKEYVKEYNDKSVTCTTPGNITIRNDKGSIAVKFRLLCTKDGEKVYDSGDEDNTKVADTGTCTAYQIKEEINLKTKLHSSLAAANKKTVGNEIYVIGSSPSNYIWYSGKMWRVISYNQITEAVKAVTVNPMTSIYFNNNGTKNYAASDVETWLNNDFLNSLKDSASYITNNNYTVGATTTKNKVALISKTDYSHINGWYGINGQNSWTMEGEIVSGTATATAASAATLLQGVRPVVTFSSDVLVSGGTGTSAFPYIIDESPNAYGISGDLLNTRYSGEYVKLKDNKIYRIVSVEGNITKVIGLYSLGASAYSDNHFDYAASTLRTTVESKFNATMKSYMTKGDFCLDTINSGDALAYRSSKCLTADRVNNSILVGLPKIGEMFTTSISGVSPYWTLNPNVENPTGADDGYYDATINRILTTGSSDAIKITQSAQIVPVFYIKETATISSGKGTPGSPYQLN